MLGELGVLAVSPELGLHNKLTDQFFIGTREVLLDVMKHNYPFIKYMMLKVGP